MRSKLNNIYISEGLGKKLACIPDVTLTTVVAPAGYGKTTAVRHFRKQLPTDCLLLQLSIFSNSQQEFWQNFAALFSPFAPNMAQALQKMGLPQDGTTRQAFLRLWRENLDQARPVYVFIDDFHLVVNPNLYDFILFLLRYAPENIHIVLLSRRPVLQAEDNLLFVAKINSITLEDLAFTAADVSHYFADCGFPLSAAQALALCETCKGWISALYLNLHSYADSGHFADPDDIRSMMGKIFFDPLPPGEKALLTALCVLPTFTVAQAAYLMQTEDVSGVLQHLVQENAFISPYSMPGTYKLHHLLQQSVYRAFEALPQSQRNLYLCRAGQWYLQAGKLLLAMRYFYAAQAFDSLLDVVEADLGACLSNEHQQEMVAWFHDCPKEVQSAHPLAMLVYARRLFTFNRRPECQAVLEELLQNLTNNSLLSLPERNNLLGEVEIVESFLKYNDIQEMSAHHQKACQLMTRPTSAVSPHAVWGYGSPSVLTSYHRQSGALDAEVQTMYRSMPFWYQLNPNQGSGSEHIMEGEVFFLRGQLVDAEICLYRGLADANEHKQLMIIFAAHFLRLRIEAFRGNFKDVERTLCELRELADAQQEYMLLHTADVCEAWLYSLFGQTEPQAEWIAQGLLENTRLLHPSFPLLHMVYGQVLLAQGEYVPLIAREAQMRRLYRLYPNLLCEIYLDIQLATAYWRLGKMELAQSHMQQALINALPDRLYMPFVENMEVSLALLPQLEATIWPEDELAPILRLCHDFQLSRRYVLSQYFGQQTNYGLSHREQEIAQLAARDKSNKEIADQLFLSENTVKAALRIIFQKLGLRDEKNKRQALRHFFQGK